VAGSTCPATFRIAPDGRVVASKINSHTDDRWSVDELLALPPAKAYSPFPLDPSLVD
jgi:hypothetical protein